MSVGYRAVGWNRQKRIYDGTLAAGVFAYLAVFLAVGAVIDRNVTIETLLIRGFGTLAFLLLHVVLCIGPLCRLDRRWLPLLYNRRHLGVAMAAFAFLHGGLSVFQFHALGDVDPLVSVLSANTRFASLPSFPFEVLGLVALAIVVTMAATSHDFWLANLTPRVWKSLHMLVYVAYALVVAHVLLGTLQAESNPVLIGAVLAGLAVVTSLHTAAGWRERACDRELALERGWVDVAAFGEIPEKRAKVVTLAGERVAVFRYDGKISAISNVCRHQQGPLGEGRIIDGCVTCPWHGYQYRPHDGCSPPPFTEKVATYAVRVDRGRVLVESRANAPGTPVEPAARAAEPVLVSASGGGRSHG